jgi:hypothetical protein
LLNKTYIYTLIIWMFCKLINTWSWCDLVLVADDTISSELFKDEYTNTQTALYWRDKVFGHTYTVKAHEISYELPIKLQDYSCARKYNQ